MNKLSPQALGVALGTLWAAYVFLCGLIAAFGWGTELVHTLASLYLGYDPTLLGALVGAVWGFVDGYIAGVVVAWIYNRLTR